MATRILVEWVVNNLSFYEWEACITGVALSNLFAKNIEVEPHKYKNEYVVNILGKLIRSIESWKSLDFMNEKRASFRTR